EGWACLFVDLRGQGSSGKAPVSFGDRERRDAAVAARWARSQAPDVPVVLVGSSMGAAAAVLAVADEPGLADGLILDGCYRNLHEASRGWWIMLAGPWLDALLRLTMPIGSLISGLRPRQVSVEDALPRLDGVPILMLNGDADPIVPWASAEANLRAAGDLAELHRFAGSGHGHGRFREPVRFRALVSDWLKNRFAPRDISDPRP
ncbi:MAG: lysophospholipase, partial [Fimbriimonadaceae bacterium]|nr:lysophospholipase [Fimbriimonadaceae bacterium]